MGFYGSSITNSNKSLFTFDKIYANRAQMDENVNTDPVFLGRYVLVEYDDPPIKGYYSNGQFFSDSTLRVPIASPKPNQMYQDVSGSGSNIFYEYKNSTFTLITSFDTSTSAFAYNYKIDVTKYGRSYDSTAWIKQFDTNTNSYKYVMVAELNTVVPNLHIAVDAPNTVSKAPYYDSASTNLDYFMHIQAPYEHRFAISEESDVTLRQNRNSWTYDGNGVETLTQESLEQDVDIFYNKAGFNLNERTYVNAESSIGFEKTSSGRKYFGTTSNLQHSTADDVYLWHIRLPEIGNAVCSLWDVLYGESRNQKYSAERADTTVIYEDNTYIGAVNRLRDLLGYTFMPIENREENDIFDASVDSIDVLYYSGDNRGVPVEYYYYAYSPSFFPHNEGNYYLDNGEYKIVNPKVIPENNRYIKQDQWVLTKLDAPNEDSFYGLILHLHRLIGTGDDDSRDLETLRGCINRIKDIVANIDTRLVPKRLVWTDDKGVITTSHFPHPNLDEDNTRIITGQGTWENRVRQVAIEEGILSESDWDTSSNTIDVNENNNDTLTFQAGNKWIGLHVDTAQQLIKILHTKSLQEEHDFASDIEIDENIDGKKQEDCPFKFPVLKTDNAGHVIGYTTETLYIPYNYRNIALAEQSIENEADIEPAYTTQEADASNDTFTFGTGNQWIKAKLDEDGIVFAHALINNKSTIEQEFRAESTEGWQYTEDENVLTIPTFQIDKAGHIVNYDSVDFYIPNIFRTLTVEDNSADTDATQKNDTIVPDSTSAEWTFKPQNKWLKISADPETDTIAIGHAHSAVPAWSFEPSIKKGLWDINNGNSFTIPTFKTDNAGHIVEVDSQTYYIPNNFQTITAGNTNSDVNARGNNNTITPSNNIDSWNLISQNKWLQVSADTDPETNIKTISIGHTYSDQGEKEFTPSATEGMKKEDNGNSFTIPTFETDNAGHIVASGEKTYYVPHTFKTIQVEKQNLTASSVDAIDQDINLTAGNITDTAIIATGNKWVQTKSSIDENKIIFSHKLSGVTSGSYGVDNLTPKFADSFTIPTYTADEAGHITESEIKTVTLPKITLEGEQAENENVLTQLNLTDDNTGSFTKTFAPVGNLKITTYEKSATIDTTDLTNTDSIVDAFNKIEHRFDTEASAREAKDNELNQNLQDESATRVAEDEKLDTAVKQEVKDRQNADIQVLTDANSYTDQQISALVSGADKALDTLKELAEALDNDPSFASSVTSTLGTLRSDLDDLSNTSGEAVASLRSDLANLSTTSGENITSLRSDLNTLSSTSGEMNLSITSLRSDLNTLSSTSGEAIASLRSGLDGLSSTALSASSELNEEDALYQSIFKKIEEALVVRYGLVAQEVPQE